MRERAIAPTVVAAANRVPCLCDGAGASLAAAVTAEATARSRIPAVGFFLRNAPMVPVAVCSLFVHFLITLIKKESIRVWRSSSAMGLLRASRIHL